jgi:hypothetical protein
MTKKEKMLEDLLHETLKASTTPTNQVQADSLLTLSLSSDARAFEIRFEVC